MVGLLPSYLLPPLRGHDKLINSVAFSPDGFKIISGCSDRTIGQMTTPFKFGMQVLVMRCLHCFEAIIVPPHSRPMDQKSSRGQITRPFEFGTQPLALRCSHHLKAMITGFALSHSRLMDLKSFRGLLTRPFEFGMQALVSRCSHPFEAMITMFVPTHSRQMDRKSSRGLLTNRSTLGCNYWCRDAPTPSRP